MLLNGEFMIFRVVLEGQENGVFQFFHAMVTPHRFVIGGVLLS